MCIIKLDVHGLGAVPSTRMCPPRLDAPIIHQFSRQGLHLDSELAYFQISFLMSLCLGVSPVFSVW